MADPKHKLFTSLADAEKWQKHRDEIAQETGEHLDPFPETKAMIKRGWRCPESEISDERMLNPHWDNLKKRKGRNEWAFEVPEHDEKHHGHIASDGHRYDLINLATILPGNTDENGQPVDWDEVKEIAQVIP